MKVPSTSLCQSKAALVGEVGGVCVCGGVLHPACSSTRLEEDDVLLAELFWVDLVGRGRAVGVAVGRGVRAGALRLVQQGAPALGGGRRVRGGVWVGLRGGHGGLVEAGGVGGMGVTRGDLWSAEVICQ